MADQKTARSAAGRTARKTSGATEPEPRPARAAKTSAGAKPSGGPKPSDAKPAEAAKPDARAAQANGGATASPGQSPEPGSPPARLDAAETARRLARIAERGQRLAATRMQRPGGTASLDPFNVSNAFAAATARLFAEPAKLAQAQMRLWDDYATLWQRTARRMLGDETVEPVAVPDKADRRFKDPAWQDSPFFDFIKQSYLLTARSVHSLYTGAGSEGLDPKEAQKVEFYTRQFVDALAPTNFPLTNPEALRAATETGGESVLKGMENLLNDLERGEGKLSIRMTDTEAFKVGENVAVTPGQVIFQNDLMQLIQYAPSTDTVLKRPLLLVPPWINKFYILDLKPKNSFIRWAVEQGHTVFVISWVNPDGRHADKDFASYMREGPLAALDVIEQVTGEHQINAIGYCIGGTLLACTLSVMAARGDDRIASATFFTTLIDFREAGELGVFIDEEQVTALETQMADKGYLEGSAMATTFNMLRANDLIWSFVVNNYLLGKDPFPFDLLYWNSDSTRMPAAMHSFYLRKMYLENKVIEPGGIVLDGVPVDLSRITVPTFILSTRDDHIAPWKSTYAATQIYGGPITFCLSGSGHIAGVVNPPEAQKYMHWVNAARPSSPDDWLAGAEQRPGSWWPEWQRWIESQDDTRVPAREIGGGTLKPIEPAPGSYVAARAL